MTGNERRELILEVLRQAIDDFLREDRKEDPNLPLHAVEQAIADRDITIAELTLVVSEKLRELIPAPVSAGNMGFAWQPREKK